MNGVRRILQRAIVAEYYRINAGFFLLLFLLLFGIISPAESLKFHYQLLQELGRSLPFFCIGLAVWTAYTAKCGVFALQVLGDPRFSFLTELQGIPRRRQYGLLLYTQVLLYLPALLYATLAAVIAMLRGHLLSGLLLLLVQGLLCAGAAALYARRINHIARESRLHRLWQLLQRRRERARSFLLYLAGYSLRHRKATLLTLKAGSLLLLQLMVWLNQEKLQPEGTYFFMVLIITAHALMPFYYVQFTEEGGWLRNLPVPRYRWALYYAGTYALLFLPELLFLLLHTHRSLPLATIGSLYLLAVAQLSFYTAVLYIPRLPIDRYTLVVFATFLLTMLLLAAIGVWALIAVLLCLAAGLFFPLFYRYEEVE